MDFKDFTAGKDDDSKRLDRIVRRILTDSPQINIHEIIRKRLVRVNEKKSSPECKIYEGDKISIAAFLFSSATENQTSTVKDCGLDIKIETVFKNSHILIINKPKGFNVQPSLDDPRSLSSIVAKQFPGDRKSISFRTGPLHRLDKNTTGLLVFSQSTEGARWFTEAMKIHSIKKTYIGLAEGKLADTQRWVDCLSNSEKKGSENFHSMEIVEQNHALAQEAVTTATPLAYGKIWGHDCTLVQYDIETGRKHQIRCQTSFHGHPLFGDSTYGGHGKAFFLHAIRLKFPKDNPVDVPEEILCPIPDDLEKTLTLSLIKWDGQLII